MELEQHHLLLRSLPPHLIHLLQTPCQSVDFQLDRLYRPLVENFSLGVNWIGKVHHHHLLTKDHLVLGHLPLQKTHHHQSREPHPHRSRMHLNLPCSNLN